MQHPDNVVFTGEKYKPYFSFWKQFVENGIEPFSFKQVSSINTDLLSNSEFSEESFSLGDQLVEKILTAVNGKDNGVLVVLLTAVGIVLNKYAEQKNVIISTPTYGLGNKEKAYVDKVPIIINVEEHHTLKEVLVALQQTIGNFYKYQNFPQSLIDYVSEGNEDIYGSNISLSYEGLHDTVEDTCDLNLFVKRRGNKIELEAKLKRDAFDDSFLDNFKMHMCQVLDKIDQLDVKVDELVLGPNKKQVDKIKTFNSYVNMVPVQSTLVDTFERQVEKTPDSIALEFKDEKLTYKMLNDRTNKFAHYILSEYNLEQQDLVGLMLDRTSEMIIALLGILKAGCAYLPIDPEYPDERKSYFLQDTQAKLLVTHSEYLFTLPDFNGKVMAIDVQMANMDECRGDNLMLDIRPEHPAYVIYTSGSTGRPKGVQVVHEGSLNMVSAQMAEFGMTSEDTTLQFASVSFDASVSEIFKTLLCGARLLLIDKNASSDPDSLIAFMKEHVVSVVTFPPSYLNILNISKLDFLRVIISAGEAANIRHAEEFSNYGTFYNAYGPSECSVCVSIERYDKAAKRLSIGRPLSNLSVHLMTASGDLSPLGLPGEICVSGKGVAQGYINDPELTAARFVEGTGERFYRTGDLGRWLPDGRLEFLGRKDSQVKIRAYRVELGEVEKAALRNSEVLEIVCTVFNDNGSQENQIVAYYTAKTDLRASELKKYLENHLPHYMIPAHLVKMDDFHYLPSGKVNRSVLPHISEITPDECYVVPQTEIEQTLAKIWADNLNRSRVGLTDNYFAIGGDSIKAIRLAVEINKQVASKVEVNDIFTHSTIQDLVKNVINDKDSQSDANELIAAENELTKFKQDILNDPRFDWPDDVEDIIPMGDLQKGMIFHSLVGAEEGLYKEQMYFQIKDQGFDYAIFKKAVNLIIKKHASLRTSFLIEEDVTAQVIYKHRDSNKVLSFEDISSKNEQEQKDYLHKILADDRYKQVNITRDQLWKMITFKLNEDEYGVLFSCNHALIDGWSNASMMTELSHVYFSLKKNEKFEPPHLQASYRDYIKEQLVISRSEEIRSFWSNELDGYVKLPLPFNKSVVPGQHQIANYIFEVPSQVTNELVALSEAGFATAKHIFLSAFCFLMRLTTGENDLTIGLVTNSRPAVEGGDKMVGAFTNTMPFRVPVKSTSAESFVKNIDAKAKKLKTFDKLSLIEIMNMVHEETTGNNPIFDIIFNYVDFHIYENVHTKSRVSDGIIDQQPRANTNTLFDFTVCKSDRQNNDFIVNLNYRASLYNEHEIEQLFDYYVRILEIITRDTKRELNPLSILREEELKKIYSINNTGVAVTSGNIVEAFKSQVEATPDATALVYKQEKYTYAQLDADSDMVAYHLMHHYNVRAGQPIGIMAGRSALTFISILAVLKAGGVYVPVSISYPDKRKRRLLEDTGIEVLITESEYMFAVMEYYSKQIFAVDIQFDELQEIGEPTSQLTSDSAAYIMYTSGSTGSPKGVIVTHGNVVNLATNQNFVAFAGEEKVLQTGAVSFDATTFEYWAPLLNGGELHIISDDDLRDVPKLKNYMAEHNITTMWFTASWFNQLVDHDIEMFSPLKHLLVGGDKLSPVHIKRIKDKYPHIEMINGYGPTETTTFAICHRIVHASNHSIPIGKPIQNAQVYLLDKEHFPVPMGVNGEIYIGGKGLSKGYWNQPKLTKERFLELEIDGKERSLYKTGDFGKLLRGLTIDFQGRKDSQVKLRGYRIELGEIESSLLSHEEVKDVRVIIKNQESGNGQLLAYATSSNEQLSDKDLLDYASKLLPDYMCPEHIFCLKKFPITPNGKIDAKRLPTPEKDLNSTESAVAPANEVQNTMVEVWQSVLGRKVSVLDNFFMIGGDSIKAIQVSSRLQKEGYAVEVKDIFTYPTIEELSTEAKEVKREVDQAPVEGEVLLTPIQKDFFNGKRDNNHHFNQAVLLEPNMELNVQCLQAVFNKIIAHHDMLRASYNEQNGKIKQEVKPITDDFEVEICDLTGEEDPMQAMETVCHQKQMSIDIGNGSLINVTLFTLSSSSVRLLIVIHHLVVDGVSWRILLEDMETLIKQYNQGDELLLPLKTDSYQTWAEKLNIYASSENEKIKEEHLYWKEVLTKKIDTIDINNNQNQDRIKDAVVDIITIDEESTSLFRGDAHKAFNTKPNDMLLASLGLSFKEAFAIDDLLISLEGHGREHIIDEIDINRTIGWFTSIFPVRISNLTDNNLSLSIKNVKENLSTIPHKGIGYGILKYLNKDFPKDFVKFRPQVSFNYLGQFDAEIGNTSFDFAKESAGNTVDPEEQRQFVLDITCMILDNTLKFNISYNPEHFVRGEVEEFKEALEKNTVQIIRYCANHEEELTPSDLTYKDISMDQLDSINQMID